MKRILSFAFACAMLVGLSAMFDSCKKNDEADPAGSGPTGSGKITYLDKSYPVSRGYYEYYGKYDQGIHYYQIYLFSEGVDIENESGSGNAIAMYCSTFEAPLPQGTIPYYSSDEDAVPNFEAQAALDYNLDTETGIRISTFTGGELTITKSSDQYTLQFSCQLEDGEILSGQYTGKVIEF